MPLLRTLVWIAAFGELLSPLRRLFPETVSTQIVGRAMLAVARHGASPAVLEAPDISRLGRGIAA